MLLAMNESIYRGQCWGAEGNWTGAPECDGIFNAKWAFLTTTLSEDLNIVNTTATSRGSENGSYVPHNLESGEGFYYKSSGSIKYRSEDYYYSRSNTLHMAMFNAEFSADEGNVSRPSLICTRIKMKQDDEESVARKVGTAVAYTAAIAAIAASISHFM